VTVILIKYHNATTRRRRNMKKLIVVISAAMLLSFGLAGCSTNRLNDNVSSVPNSVASSNYSSSSHVSSSHIVSSSENALDRIEDRIESGLDDDQLPEESKAR